MYLTIEIYNSYYYVVFLVLSSACLKYIKKEKCFYFQPDGQTNFQETYQAQKRRGACLPPPSLNFEFSSALPCKIENGAW